MPAKAKTLDRITDGRIVKITAADPNPVVGSVFPRSICSVGAFRPSISAFQVRINHVRRSGVFFVSPFLLGGGLRHTQPCVEEEVFVQWCPSAIQNPWGPCAQRDTSFQCGQCGQQEAYFLWGPCAQHQPPLGFGEFWVKRLHWCLGGCQNPMMRSPH